jgi:hypothetical protein
MRKGDYMAMVKTGKIKAEIKSGPKGLMLVLTPKKGR